MKSKSNSVLGFIMTFDPGDALIFFRQLDQISGVFFSHLRDQHGELWRDRSSHAVVEFRQERGVCLTVKLANTTQEIAVDCKINPGTDIGAQVIPCCLTMVNHSTGSTNRYNSQINHGVLEKLGLACEIKS